jgi:hypothetical protein
MFLNGDL